MSSQRRFFCVTEMMTCHGYPSASGPILLLCGDIHLNLSWFWLQLFPSMHYLLPPQSSQIHFYCQSRRVSHWSLLSQKPGSLLRPLVLNGPTLLHLHGFTLISCPRPTPVTKSHYVGGDTAFFTCEPASFLSVPAAALLSSAECNPCPSPYCYKPLDLYN
jgi:hypothetical protein